MRDKVDAARRLGLAADTVTRPNPDEWQRIGGAVDRDDWTCCLSPSNGSTLPSFRDQLAQVAPRLGLLVVDEAHCIFDWGHDFRPYRRIREVLDRLPAATPVLACTGTANARVVPDVAAQLGVGTTTLRVRWRATIRLGRRIPLPTAVLFRNAREHPDEDAASGPVPQK